MGRLDDMRRAVANPPPKIGEVNPEKPPRPAAKKIVPPPGGSGVVPPKQVKPPAPKITHQCGHVTSVRQFETSPCVACCKAARAARRAEKLARGRNLSWSYKDGRLPDGSQFFLDPYVGKESGGPRWSGRLVVPGFGEFTGSTAGVESLLRHLWKCYVREAERRDKAAEPTPPETPE